MSIFSVLVSSKLATVLTVGALAAGGSAAAAFTGHLPTPLQHDAHVLVGAPDSTDDPTDPTATPSATPSATPTPFGPATKGHASFGLCTAYSHGGLNVSSTAYLSLVSVAGGVDNVAAFCATVGHPGNAASHRPLNLTHGLGHAAHGKGLSHMPTSPNTHKPTTPGKP